MHGNAYMIMKICLIWSVGYISKPKFIGKKSYINLYTGPAGKKKDPHPTRKARMCHPNPHPNGCGARGSDRYP
jgi:hypothetical protein